MPAESPRNAVARQWEVLKLVPSSGQGKTAEDLSSELRSRGYRTGLRTIQRDLAALQELFPLTRSEEKPYHWKWTGASELAVLGLSMPDALALTLLERFVKPLLPSSVTSQLDAVFQVARTKLQHQKKNQLGRWSELVAVADRGIQVVPPNVNPTVLEVVRAALLAGEKTKVAYTRGDGESRTGRTISPLGLVQSGAITYLVAYSDERDPPAVVNLPLHRMTSASRSYEPAQRPLGFRLHEYIDAGGMQFGEGGDIRLKARISDMLVRQLADTKLSADQSISMQTDGSGILTASVKNTWRLKWWILEKSGDIEVIQPSALRRDIATKLRLAASTYHITGNK